MLTAWLVVVLLIFINAFYVTAEFGAVSVRRTKVRQLAKSGHRLALRLLPVLDDPARLDRYIAACQIGITWSSLVLGAYSQAFITPGVIALLEARAGFTLSTAQSAATIGVLILMTTFQVVVGELIPKSLALQYPTKAALYTLPPMKASLVLYSWFLKVLNGSGLALLRMLGYSKAGHAHIHSPEEIELLIAESRKGGLLEPEEHERLQRALRLVSRPVRLLMVPRSHVVSIDVTAEPDQLVGLLETSPFTRIPVRDDATDNIIGLLHTKDVVAFVVQNGRAPSPRDVMRPLAKIPETVHADRLFAFFREARTHQAAVVDEYSVVGLVTLGDLVSELLGESSSEFRAGQPKPTQLPDGRVRLPGLMRVDEAEQWIGVAVESPADTLGGHVMHVLGKIPAAGERLKFGEAEVEVELVNANTIVSLLVRPASVPKESADG
ncbi:MAG TPA: hemolysin family protein [Dehalococcoidia bacterium]|nr:hemolysin family protein [Dehalococcoidia bacterium]